MPRRNVSWFTRDEYDALRRLLPNVDNLPNTFDEWSEATAKQIAELESHGIIAEKAIIHPQEFAAWCRASGLDCSLATLGAFTVVVARIQREQRAASRSSSGDEGGS